ncbi:MAG: TonB-dependent receptor [Glaciecola sp.]
MTKYLPSCTFISKMPYKASKLRRSSIQAAVALALVANNAYAFSATQADDVESQVEVITVTADISQRSLSQLPGSAVVIDADTLSAKQARHMQDVLVAIPNVNLTAGASRGKFVQIRGIGERSQFAEPINPSVGLLFDDLDLSGLGSLMTVFDSAQVEVLSGPQSVATGMNSLAGIVKVVSNAPTDYLFAKVSASYAEQDEHRISGVYSNALTETTNVRLSAQNTQSNGFVTNAFLGRDDTNNIDETTFSAWFDTAFNDTTDMDVHIYHFDIDNGYDAFSLFNDNITLSDEPGEDSADVSAVSIKVGHNYSQHRIEASASHISGDTLYSYDEDWTYTGIHPFGYTSFTSFDRDITRNRIDLKLASSPKSDSTASYLVGINYNSNDEDAGQWYNGDVYSSTYQPSNSAIYGQYQYTATDQLSITGAARIEKFSADFNDSDGLIAAIDDNLVAGSLSLEYQIADAFLFSSVSRGYKAGGFNFDQRISPANRYFDPEYNMNYELGVKGSAYDGLASISLSFFYMRRDDAQVSDFFTINTTDDSGAVITTFVDVIDNSASAVNQGLEVSTNWDVSNDWRLVFNAGYLDATRSGYTQANGDFVAARELAQAPKYSAYLSSTYQLSDRFSWFVDADIKDDYFFSEGHNERAPFTAVVNTELSYRADGYVVSLWLKNVFDRTVYTRGFGGFPNDPRDEYTTFGPYNQIGQERQIGVNLSYTWE